MALNLYNLKKWTKMVTGNSILHVNQGPGKIYSLVEVEGYYNDLTEKVIKDPDFDNLSVPVYKIETGENIYFPISIFQYGLGAYDMYLLKKEDIYLEKFKLCVDWALEYQNEKGAWDTFSYKNPNAPYSAMAQGEGISLLTRAYSYSNNEKYLMAAKKATDFMLLPIEKGGTTVYIKNQVYLKEYTDQPVVLNGWIFAIFGLYDYLKVNDDEKVVEIYKKTLNTISEKISLFDNSYWSKYDSEKIIASPFYHSLHIAQLRVLYNLTKIESFNTYANLWEKKNFNFFYKNYAFFVKVFQKLKE